MLRETENMKDQTDKNGVGKFAVALLFFKPLLENRDPFLTDQDLVGRGRRRPYQQPAIEVQLDFGNALA